MSLEAANLLLDTGILIHLCRGGEAEARLQARYGLRDRRLVPWTRVVCVGEVQAMARRNDWGEPRLKVLRDLLAHVVVLNLRPGVILDAYAELDAHLSHIGRRMGQQNDLWIAATARATGATVLTTDRDFDVLHPDLVQRGVGGSSDPQGAASLVDALERLQCLEGRRAQSRTKSGRGWAGAHPLLICIPPVPATR